MTDARVIDTKTTGVSIRALLRPVLLDRRSAEVLAHEHPRAATAHRRGLGRDLEALALEEVGGADVAADHIHPLPAGEDRITLDDVGAVPLRVLDGAVQQPPHEPVPAEPRAHDEADRDPRVEV